MGYVNKIHLLFLSVVCMCSCATNDVVETTGKLWGVVTDKATGGPVPFAYVTLAGYEPVITSATGAYSFNELEEGKYKVICSKDGYQKIGKSIEVIAGKTLQCDFVLDCLAAEIIIDKTVLDFGSEESNNTLSFKLLNENFQSIDYSIVNNCSWLQSVSPNQGTLEYGKTITLVATIDRSYLKKGDNVDKITVVTNSYRQNITIKAYKAITHKADVEVVDVDILDSSSAVLYGKVVDAGLPPYTSCGFVYGTEYFQPDPGSIEVLSSATLTETDFSVTLYGLEIGKVYYARAFVKNDCGISYSLIPLKVQTAGSLPKVSLGAFETGESSSAMLFRGYIDAPGDPEYDERGFVYCEYYGQPTLNAADGKLIVPGDGVGIYETVFKPVKPYVEYYVRAYAKNAAGVAYSPIKTFMVKKVTPQVEITSVSIIDNNVGSVYLQGRVIDSGIPEYNELGFIYAKASDSTYPTINDSCVVAEDRGDNTFGAVLTGLDPKEKYYIRAYARSDERTGCSDNVCDVFGSEVYTCKEDIASFVIQKATLGPMTWNDAKAACQSSTYAGYDDWRLPTPTEMTCIQVRYWAEFGFIKSDLWYYWCDSGVSSTRIGVMSYDEYTFSSPTESHYARCVRTLN